MLAMWLLVWLFLILTSGCTQTEVEEHDIPPHALKDIEAGFNLHVLANQTPVIRSVKFTANGTIDTDSLTAAVRDTVQTLLGFRQGSRGESDYQFVDRAV